MSKVGNEKVQVPCTKDMNDMDIINDMMQSEKDTSNNYSIAMDEMSNKNLFKKIFKIFEETKDAAREAFDLAFQNGWYTLEKAEETKIQQAYDKANQQVKELS